MSHVFSVDASLDLGVVEQWGTVRTTIHESGGVLSDGQSASITKEAMFIELKAAKHSTPYDRAAANRDCRQYYLIKVSWLQERIHVGNGRLVRQYDRSFRGYILLKMYSNHIRP